MSIVETTAESDLVKVERWPTERCSGASGKILESRGGRQVRLSAGWVVREGIQPEQGD